MSTSDTVLLLRALEDTLPSPETWTGKLVKASAPRGPAASKWQPCTTCHGQGVTADKFKRTTVCPECSGRGRIHVDDYTRERMGSTETGLVTRTATVTCDRCGGDGAWKFARCELCDGTGRRSAGPRTLEQTERRQQEQNLNAWPRDPVFDDLTLRLLWLQHFARWAFRFVWTVHVSKVRPQASLIAEEQHTMTEGVAWIDYRMPAGYQVPSWVRISSKREHDHGNGVRGRWANAAMLTKRDKEIRGHSRHGKAHQWIAREYGITPARVSQIVNAA